MLCNTNFDGPKLEGHVYDEIPDSVAKRWEKNGIATIVPEVGGVEAGEEIGEEDDDEIDKAANEGKKIVVEGYDYTKMDNKALFALCKERNIVLQKEMVNGKTPEEKQAYLISKLEEADAVKR
jgi:hypothetical protein